MVKKMKRLTGWGTRGRPFSPAEYKKSFIKKNLKMTYPAYLCNTGMGIKKRGLNTTLGKPIAKKPSPKKKSFLGF